MKTEHICYYDSPLGILVLKSDGEALSSLCFADHYEGSDKNVFPEDHVLEETIYWLDAYFQGEDPGTTPKLKPQGTAFQERVWQILLTIPYGKTMSYGQIAEIIAEERGMKKMSAQAIGNAVGRNPIALIIPCHRVIGSDGSLTGYAAGLERKKKLLEREGICGSKR